MVKLKYRIGDSALFIRNSLLKIGRCPLFYLFCFLFVVLRCSLANAQNLPLDLISLPEGFKIEIYSDDVPFAREMALSPNGILYVGTRKKSHVYALGKDKNGDNQADYVKKIVDGFFAPNGVEYHKGSLYVAEVHRITRFDNIDQTHLDNDVKYTVITDSLPRETWHGWRYIKIGEDEKLYIPIGAPCNVCERSDERFASIMRMDLDGNNPEIIAKGIRNSVGFDWHPLTKDLWFTDNGRDNLGDDLPPDELNQLSRLKMHFGFPYCHGKGISDPQFGDGHSCKNYEPAKVPLQAHTASLGMLFYTGKMFPEKYRNSIFIAEHGSWNRSSKVGYRVSFVQLDESQPQSYEPFAEGWMQNEKVWGRPVDLEMMPDGSLLVSDDYAGVIYRISYNENEK